MADESAVVEMQQAVQTVAQWANGLTITTQADAQQAMQRIAEIKGAKKRWLDYWSPLKTAANAAWKGIVAKEKEGTDIADIAEATVKRKVLAWQQAEQEKAAAEQRRLQAIADEQARREREKQESAARIQREKEAEANRQAEAARQAIENAARIQREKEQQQQREQEAARQALLNEQNAARRAELQKAEDARRAEVVRLAAEDAKRRAEMQKEAEKRQAEANAAAAKAAVREEEAAIVSAPVITVAAPMVATKGVSTSTIWRAELVSLAELLAAVQRDPEGLAAGLVTFNQSAADKLAKAMHDSVKVPGVRFVSSQTMNVRAA